VASRQLHIGVDGREIVGQITGVGRYLIGLLRIWAKDPACRHHFTVFLPGTAPPALRDLLPRLRVESAPFPTRGTWWEQSHLARMANAAQLDVFYAPAYTAPIRLGCPFVVVVHDVSYFAHPEWFSWREGLRRRWLTRLVARRAARIISVSEFSAGEIAKYLGADRRLIVLAPGGTPAPDDDDPDARAPVVLYAGSLLNRRRIPELIQGFALAAARVPDARLVLAGANRTHPRLELLEITRAHGVADRVDWLQYVPDDALVRLYRRARVFAFLSDYEGFGMTPFEAIAHGAPPLLLDTAVSREIYGPAARLVAPDPAAIGDALTTLLTDDHTRAALLAAGRARLGQYSWTESAAVTLHALEEAANR
jgi:glycosyltransferase involved in cell wall biosynthesis